MLQAQRKKESKNQVPREHHELVVAQNQDQSNLGDEQSGTPPLRPPVVVIGCHFLRSTRCAKKKFCVFFSSRLVLWQFECRSGPARKEKRGGGRATKVFNRPPPPPVLPPMKQKPPPPPRLTHNTHNREKGFCWLAST